jgi:hypothetical protein
LVVSVVFVAVLAPPLFNLLFWSLSFNFHRRHGVNGTTHNGAVGESPRTRKGAAAAATSKGSGKSKKQQKQNKSRELSRNQRTRKPPSPYARTKHDKDVANKAKRRAAKDARRQKREAKEQKKVDKRERKHLKKKLRSREVACANEYGSGYKGRFEEDQVKEAEQRAALSLKRKEEAAHELAALREAQKKRAEQKRAEDAAKREAKQVSVQAVDVVSCVCSRDVKLLRGTFWGS